jgi:parallel beta-helix repeat protein
MPSKREKEGFMKSARVSIGAVLVLGLAVASTPTAATAKSVTVKPGQSIQAAVDAASPGDTINVMPGDYTEMHPGTAAVRITKPLNLIAKGAPPATQKVRILPGPGQMHGILVEPANPGDPDIDGLEIKGFTVQGFSNMGIWLRHVKNFTIENNESIDNQENGIFPTLSANGLVKKNVAYGSLDSALWVEGSQNVRVVNNELHNSPTGLEITISNEITVEQNDVHDNTVGIGLYHPGAAGLPPAEQPPGPYGDWHIVNNDVHNNNFPNPAPGGETGALPPGIGVLLLGVDNVGLQNNRVEGNNYVGIGLVDWCLAVVAAGLVDNVPDCVSYFPDHTPDYNQVTGTKLADNHTDTSPELLPAADILDVGLDYLSSGMFGTGTGNCFSGNKLIKTPGNPPPLTFPDPLPVCD